MHPVCKRLHLEKSGLFCDWILLISCFSGLITRKFTRRVIKQFVWPELIPTEVFKRHRSVFHSADTDGDDSLAEASQLFSNPTSRTCKFSCNNTLTRAESRFRPPALHRCCHHYLVIPHFQVWTRPRPDLVFKLIREIMTKLEKSGRKKTQTLWDGVSRWGIPPEAIARSLTICLCWHSSCVPVPDSWIVDDEKWQRWFSVPGWCFAFKASTRSRKQTCCQGLRVRKVLSSCHASTGVIWGRCRSGHRVMSRRRVNMCCLVGQLHRNHRELWMEALMQLRLTQMFVRWLCSWNVPIVSAQHIYSRCEDAAFSLLGAPTACQPVDVGDKVCL